MLKLKLQYFGHLMRRVDSLEKTLMLGGVGGKRRRGWQRMHHWLDGRESEWTLGVGDGQGSLACCSPLGFKESDKTVTEQQKAYLWLIGKRPWCWERLKVGGEGDNRGRDGWMALLTAWSAAVHGIAKSQTQPSDWTELNWFINRFFSFPNHLTYWGQIQILKKSVSFYYSSTQAFSGSPGAKGKYSNSLFWHTKQSTEPLPHFPQFPVMICTFHHHCSAHTYLPYAFLFLFTFFM